MGWSRDNTPKNYDIKTIRRRQLPLRDTALKKSAPRSADCNSNLALVPGERAHLASFSSRTPILLSANKTARGTAHKSTKNERVSLATLATPHFPLPMWESFTLLEPPSPPSGNTLVYQFTQRGEARVAGSHKTPPGKRPRKQGRNKEKSRHASEHCARRALSKLSGARDTTQDAGLYWTSETERKHDGQNDETANKGINRRAFCLASVMECATERD